MNRREKTKEVHDWMKTLPDDQKALFAINWRIPHTLFNVACKFRDSEELQGVDWFKIYQSRDLGYWQNGNKVVPQSFR